MKTTTNKKAHDKLFSVILSYLLYAFSITPRDIASASKKQEYLEKGLAEISVADISGWKTRNPPQKDKYESLKSVIAFDIVVEKDEAGELYLRHPEAEIIAEIKAIFSRYGLVHAGEFIDREEMIVDKVGKTLDIAFANRHRRPVGRECAEEKEMTGYNAKSIKKLVVFDLYGTLITGVKYSWELLYQAVGISVEECREHKRKFERGDISYPEWVATDCKMLHDAGLTMDIAQNAVASQCSLTANFTEAIGALKEAGCAVGIISGGSDIVLYSMIPDADELFDRNIYINKTKFREKGELVDIEPTPYDWDDGGKVRGVAGKQEGLKKMCQKYGLSLEDSVFVGDDDNDFKAMSVAGGSILYSAGCPSAHALGAGERKLPHGVVIINDNDLMKVAEVIINSSDNSFCAR